MIVSLLANNESRSKHNLRITINSNEDGHGSVNENVMTKRSCHQWNKEILTHTAWRARGSSSCFQRQNPAQ